MRLVAAMLITVAVIGLSAVATHTPTQNQSSLTLKSIRTDKSTTLYVDNGQDRCGAWFREMVLPTSAYAHNDQDRCGAWFREQVLPTGDSRLMTENLKSVAATL